MPADARKNFTSSSTIPRADRRLHRLAGELAQEVIVRKYLSDEHEYVRRRTLLASRERLPELAESVALSWLDSPEPYSRMVALDTLYTLGSPHSAAASVRLTDDEADVVRSRVRELVSASANRAVLPRSTSSAYTAPHERQRVVRR